MFNRRKAIAALAGVIGMLFVSGVGTAAYATSTKDSRANDHVLIGVHQDFQEFFKRDGESKGAGQTHNNYLYTSSAAVDAPPYHLHLPGGNNYDCIRCAVGLEGGPVYELVSGHR